jgi:hypothetical protein
MRPRIPCRNTDHADIGPSEHRPAQQKGARSLGIARAVVGEHDPSQFGATRDKDWALGMLNEFVGHGSEQGRPDGPHTAAADHEQVWLEPVCRIEDRAPGSAEADLPCGGKTGPIDASACRGRQPLGVV